MVCPECGIYGRCDDSYAGRLCPDCEDMMRDLNNDAEWRAGYQDTLRLTRQVSGSGPEDIGGYYESHQFFKSPSPPPPISNEERNRLAEEAARTRRLHRDAIVHAALNKLGAIARDFPFPTAYIAAYVGHGVDADDVYELLAEIRAELSPLVK